MTEIVQQPEAKTKKPKAKKAAQPSRTARIRTLLAEGRSVAEIAAVLGVTKQMIYNVAYSVRKKEKSAKHISPRTGKPVRKYTKRGSVKADKPMHVDEATLLELDRKRMKDELFDLKELNEQLVRDIQTATTPKIVYREIPVPQPFSHYTFMQRLRILFLGGAA